MIKIEVLPKKIIIKGHAMYDDYGKDIVCASVSSILITTVNACLSFDKEAINYEQEEDIFTLSIIKEDEITKKLIENMLHLLRELSNDYPKNIRIK